MIDRKYSVQEIDSMRRWLRNTEIYLASHNSGLGFKWDELDRNVEDKLRTYMMAGIDPKDIEDQYKRMVSAHQAAMKAQGT
jgi:hypothetical protein